MSSKKNKSKTKKASEGDSSFSLKEGLNDSSSLQTSRTDGGSCKSLNCNSFTVIDFIEKGKKTRHESKHLTGCIIYKSGITPVQTKLPVLWRWKSQHGACCTHRTSTHWCCWSICFSPESFSELCAFILFICLQHLFVNLFALFRFAFVALFLSLFLYIHWSSISQHPPEQSSCFNKSNKNIVLT